MRRKIAKTADGDEMKRPRSRLDAARAERTSAKLPTAKLHFPRALDLSNNAEVRDWADAQD
jgi:hypothetical protein